MVFLTPSCPQSNRGDRLCILMSTLKYLVPRKETITNLQEEKMWSLFLCIVLHPPPQHVSDSDRDWMAEFLSGGSEGATLGCRSKPCSLVNFNNKVYIFMSICLTTVLFLKWFRINRMRKYCLLVFTISNMIQIIILQKYGQSIEVTCIMEEFIINGVCVERGWVGKDSRRGGWTANKEVIGKGKEASRQKGLHGREPKVRKSIYIKKLQER